VSHELRELYQEVILEHNKKPRNFHKMKDANHHAEGFNPLCGDRITLYLKLNADKIEKVSFEGSGCAISQASTSMLTATLKGKTVKEAEALFEAMHQMLHQQPGDPVPDGIGKLAVFSGVCEFPARVKCASLAWYTLKAAIKDKSDPVTTE